MANPTDQQKGQVAALVNGHAWLAWWDAHGRELQAARAEAESAIAADDTGKLADARQRYTQAIKTAPHTGETFEQLKAIFTPAQQEKLDDLEPDIRTALRKQFHRMLIPKVSATRDQACATCHMPQHASTAPAR